MNKRQSLHKNERGPAPSPVILIAEAASNRITGPESPLPRVVR